MTEKEVIFFVGVCFGIVYKFIWDLATGLYDKELEK
jgi:hypothetical protein